MGQIVSFLSSRPIDPPSQNYSFRDSIVTFLEQLQRIRSAIGEDSAVQRRRGSAAARISQLWLVICLYQIWHWQTTCAKIAQAMALPLEWIFRFKGAIYGMAHHLALPLELLVKRLCRKSKEEPTLPIRRPIQDSSRPIDPPSEEYSSPGSVHIPEDEPILPIRRPIQDSPFKSSRPIHPTSQNHSFHDSIILILEDEEPSRSIHDSPFKSSRPIHQPSREFSRHDSLRIPVEEPALPILRPIHDSPSKSSRPIHPPSQSCSRPDSLPIPVEKSTLPSLRPINDSSFPIHPPSQIDSFLDSLLIPNKEQIHLRSQQHSFRDSVLIPWQSIESIGESISYAPPPTVESRSESTSPRSKKKDEAKTMAITEKWLNHYSSGQKILLVGEGDFSFSASLAMAFGTATNMIATSLNSRDFLNVNYRNAPTNIMKLTCRGCKVIHGVDVGTMANHPSLNALQFDRLIFNFPHDGFISNEPRNSQLRRHRGLIKKFLANGKRMINKRGQIHITHKCNEFFLEWNLVLLAMNEGLMLREEVKFNLEDYPGYNTKYGFGGDRNFDCNPSKTYKFALIRT